MRCATTAIARKLQREFTTRHRRSNGSPVAALTAATTGGFFFTPRSLTDRGNPPRPDPLTFAARPVSSTANHINSPPLQWFFTGLFARGAVDVWKRKVQDYKEIDRVRKDPIAVNSQAKRLLAIPNHDWNDWELDFLEHMASHRGPDPITTRQGEKLIELRDESEYHSSVKGFSVASLIQNCWLARGDLNREQDRKFIEDLKVSGASAIKSRQLRKLLACARELGEVEKYVAVA